MPTTATILLSRSLRLYMTLTTDLETISIYYKSQYHFYHCITVLFTLSQFHLLPRAQLQNEGGIYYKRNGIKLLGFCCFFPLLWLLFAGEGFERVAGVSCFVLFIFIHFTSIGRVLLLCESFARRIQPNVTRSIYRLLYCNTKQLYFKVYYIYLSLEENDERIKDKFSKFSL